MVAQRRGNVKVNGDAAIEKKIKRGNAQRQASQWKRRAGTLWCAVLTAVATLGWWYFTLDQDITETLVSRSVVLQRPKVFPVQCSEDYENYKRFPGCTPLSCARAVTDTVVTREEALALRQLAERGLALGGSEGGASILDLHSGALSMGQQFVNIYKYSGAQIKDVFSKEDFDLYKDVRSRIQGMIADTFGLDSSRMYLTKPTFFSRINSTEARTAHDEYWHPHIDKVTYGSFDYTSLLYLSDYGSDFGGGRFIFIDASGNRTVEPRAGRVSFFSSGSENLHRVEKVTWGTRYAITVSFTCDPDHAIDNPTLPSPVTQITP
ncbi:urotensin-2 receptor 2 [Clupea harengus]|uniref:Urotensin-2 receptor 2 n=1 Tax=Clupea harengus TaxID=7950 RepID=A0A6P3WBJ6_CLUHA|nr:urotensin-2 receptor 2 [Clupea harengus]